VKTLLDAGADANAKDVRGMTPLMLAVQTDRLDPEMIRLLLNHHADLATKSVRGGTALDWARKFRSAPYWTFSAPFVLPAEVDLVPPRFAAVPAPGKRSTSKAATHRDAT
jgi:hypothetical protein